MNTVYKVVCVESDGTMVSCVTNMMEGGRNNPFCLTYEMGKETRAEEGTLGILCFGRLKDARAWTRHFPDERILVCKTRFKPRKVGKICRDIEVRGISTFNLFYEKEIRQLWARGTGHITKRHFATPLGTRAVMSLTPITIAKKG